MYTVHTGLLCSRDCSHTESGGVRRCRDITEKNQAVGPAQKACFTGSSSACKFYTFVEREVRMQVCLGTTKLLYH